MFDPMELSRLSRIIYEEKVLQAQNNRPAQRKAKNGIGLAQQVGDFLIATGQKLKGQPQSATMPLTVAER